MTDESKTTLPERHAKKKRFTRRRKIQLCILVLIAIGLWWAWHIVSAPVTGHTTVTKGAIPKQVKKVEKPLPASTIESPYFQLALPEGYRVQAPAQSVPGLLYQQTIIKPSAFGSVVINIAVKAMSEGGLSADTAYQLRIKSPSRYAMSQQTVNGQTVILASDAESASVVAFWARGGYLATISASTGLGNPAADNNATQKKVLQPVLDAWQWQ